MISHLFKSCAGSGEDQKQSKHPRSQQMDASHPYTAKLEREMSNQVLKTDAQPPFQPDPSPMEEGEKTKQKQNDAPSTT